MNHRVCSSGLVLQLLQLIYMHSVEYEISGGGVPMSTAHLNYDDAPCAVCYVATHVKIHLADTITRHSQ